jgi:hypothetical protein
MAKGQNNPLSNLATNLVGGIAGNNGASRLGSGGDPTSLGQDHSNISRLYVLPEKTSPQTIVKLQSENGEMDAQNELLKKQSKLHQELAGATIENLKIRTTHSQNMMGIEEQYQTANALHGRAVAGHKLKSAETSAYHDGWTKVMDVSVETIQL